jgi:hypothetical protein
MKWELPRNEQQRRPSKGSLAHFESVFVGNQSLARLRY